MEQITFGIRNFFDFIKLPMKRNSLVSSDSNKTQICHNNQFYT